MDCDSNVQQSSEVERSPPPTPIVDVEGDDDESEELTVVDRPFVRQPEVQNELTISIPTTYGQSEVTSDFFQVLFDTIFVNLLILCGQ